jgi:hypothetical protein
VLSRSMDRSQSCRHPGPDQADGRDEARDELRPVHHVAEEQGVDAVGGQTESEQEGLLPHRHERLCETHTASGPVAPVVPASAVRLAPDGTTPAPPPRPSLTCQKLFSSITPELVVASTSDACSTGSTRRSYESTGLRSGLFRQVELLPLNHCFRYFQTLTIGLDVSIPDSTLVIKIERTEIMVLRDLDNSNLAHLRLPVSTAVSTLLLMTLSGTPLALVDRAIGRCSRACLSCATIVNWRPIIALAATNCSCHGVCSSINCNQSNTSTMGGLYSRLREAARRLIWRRSHQTALCYLRPSALS